MTGALLHPPHLIPMSAWKEEGYVRQLEKDFRLVMIEPLGQGLSDAPEDSSHYTISSRIRHILDIMREVQADFAFFFGVGLGAQVGFQMSKEFPRRIRSLISVGAQPYQELEEAKYLAEKLDKLRSGNVNAYLQQWHSLDHLSEEEDCDLEFGVFEELSQKGEIMVYKHSGHWECMDNERDVILSSFVLTIILIL